MKGLLILLLLACGSVEKSTPEVVTIESVTEERCTEWKSICVGDTVTFSYGIDTTICVVTKIVYRRNDIGDLIGGKSLTTDDYLSADEHYFSHRPGGR